MRVKLQLAAFLLSLVTAWAASANVNVSGKWKAQTTSARGISKQTITLTQKGSSFFGEMITSEGLKESIKDGTVKGKEIEFNVERRRAGGKTVLVLYTGKVNGDEITGTFIGASGNTVNWKATREMLKL